MDKNIDQHYTYRKNADASLLLDFQSHTQGILDACHVNDMQSRLMHSRFSCHPKLASNNGHMMEMLQDDG